MSDGVEVLGGEVVDHAGEVGEALGVDGEGAVLVLVVDVELDGVGGDLVGAQAVGDLARPATRGSSCSGTAGSRASRAAAAAWGR